MSQPSGQLYYRGHVRSPDKDHLIDLSYYIHGHRLRSMQPHFALPAAFDSRTLNLIGAVKNQSQCGSCWDFSGTGDVEVAFNKAGVGGGPGQMVLSEQYTLSCGNNGGCNGDDNVTVLKWALSTGLPLTKDYGLYTGYAGSCNYRQGMQLYKIDQWGFADSNGGNGVTPVQDIKTAIVAYGCVGCAVAAGGGEWDNAGPDTVLSGSSHNIDHDVILVGWDDSKGKNGAWIMRNSWGTSWANQGYVWIEYGAYDIGTEAVWSFVKPVNPGPLDWLY
jgi:C1A family cysteine protease